MSEDSQRIVGGVLVGTGLWVTIIMIMRNVLKSLLSWHGWMYARHGSVSWSARLWMVRHWIRSLGAIGAHWHCAQQHSINLTIHRIQSEPTKDNSKSRFGVTTLKKQISYSTFSYLPKTGKQSHDLSCWKVLVLTRYCSLSRLHALRPPPLLFVSLLVILLIFTLGVWIRCVFIYRYWNT